MNRIIFVIFLCLSSLVLPQNDINNRYMLATSYEQAGEYEKAKNILEEIYQRAPDNYQFFDALNRVYLQLKNYNASEQLISGNIKLNPQDVNLYGLLGKTYHLKGEEQKAFETWDKALQLSNNNPSVYRLISNYAIERRAFNKAIEILNRGKELSNNSNIFSFDLANLYSITMNFRKAAEECLFILQRSPNEVFTVRSRIMAYINRPDALKQTIEVFEKSSDNIPEIKATLAWLYTEDKKFSDAYNIYKELDKLRGNNGAELFNYAQLLYSAREYMPAAEVYGDLADKYQSSPFSSAAKLGYAKSMEEIFISTQSRGDNWQLMKKSVDRSTNEINKLLDTYLSLSEIISNNESHTEAAFRAGRIYLHLKNNESEAEDLFLRIIEDFPVSNYAPPAALELAGIYVKRGDLSKAEEFLKKSASLPRSTDEHRNNAKLLLAEIKFFRQDFEASLKLLKEITSNLKDNSANDAIELSMVLNTKMNDSLSLLVFSEAEFLARQEKFEQAEAKYSSISAEKGGFLLGSLARIREAEVKIALGKAGDSVQLLEKISEENSRNIYADKALYLLGNIYEFSLDDPQKALGTYEKLLARFPSSMYLDEAREHIISLKNKLS